MDPLAVHCPNLDCVARGHTARGNIKIHCHKRRRYRCTECGKTFSERQGTPFHYSHTSEETMTCVLTLIAYGCPVAAIEAAMFSAPWHGVMDQVNASRSRQWPSRAKSAAREARLAR